MSSSDRTFAGVVSWVSNPAEDARLRDLADAPDDLLIGEVKIGNQVAFAILMRRHARVVLAVGRRVLRDQGAAEDLVQDVFLLVHRRAQSFDPQRGVFRAWLIQIAYNEAYRSRQRLQLRHVYEERTLEDCANVLEAAGTPEYHALVRQGERRMRKALSELSAKQAQTLELFFFEGYTLREISERMGDSFENVRHYYYRALKALKEIIGPAEANE